MKLLDIMTEPWAITQEKLEEIAEVYRTHLRGEKIDLKIFKESRQKPQDPYTITNGVAVIDVLDIISKRLSFFSWFFGGTSTLDIADALKVAMTDSDVKAVVFNIDSPGGAVDGTAELAEIVRGFRGVKPIVAHTDGMMASAAYWIGSAADRIYISSDTTQVGSIGVVAVHIDYSKAYEKEGIKITEIVAGKYKRIASAYKPLSKEGKQTIQDEVDYIYSAFVNDVALNKDTDVDTVLKDMADGRVFIGKQAIGAGLVDGVISMDNLINKLAAGDAADSVMVNVRGNIINSDAIINAIKTMEDETMDLIKLKAEFPEVYQAAFKEGETNGIDLGKSEAEVGFDEKLATARRDGADDERQRIIDVKAQLIPGHEALIESLMFNGKTTGPEAAVKVVAAEKILKETKAKDFKDDGNNIAVIHDNAADKINSSKNDANLPVEERTKKIWDSTPAIRDEFGDYDAYLAFVKADEAGRVKVLKNKED